MPPLYWEETDTQRCQGMLTQVPLSLWPVNDQNTGDLTPSGHILFLLPILLSVCWEDGVPKKTTHAQKANDSKTNHQQKAQTLSEEVMVNFMSIGCMRAQSCLTLCLCDLWTVALQAPLSMEFFQAIILQWVAISFFKGSSWPRDQTCVSYTSCIARRVLYHWAIWEARAARPFVKLF